MFSTVKKNQTFWNFLLVNFEQSPKFPNTDFRIRTEYGDFRRLSLYSVKILENQDQKNSAFGHFLKRLLAKQFQKKI